MTNCTSVGAGLNVRTKNVSNWNAMSSIGVIGISTSSRFLLEWNNRHPRRPFAPGAGGAHDPLIAFRANLCEAIGLAGGDQAVERGERRVAVGAEDDGGGQGLAVELHAGRLGVEPDQLRLALDRLDRLVGQLDLAVEEEVALLVDVQHELVGGDPSPSSIGRAEPATGSRTRWS